MLFIYRFASPFLSRIVENFLLCVHPGCFNLNEHHREHRNYMLARPSLFGRMRARIYEMCNGIFLWQLFADADAGAGTCACSQMKFPFVFIYLGV